MSVYSDGRHCLFILRYHSLVTKYGRLEPLAEIDLRPRCRAQVEVHCEEKVEQVSSVHVLSGSPRSQLSINHFLTGFSISDIKG